ncbi:hypothetical protein PVAP13_4NG142600 [Panicum virgatum]|uniref:Uncharacterized protein n=1 Tax=Panicum virgatum TaxID=38727 RepID=A0A8T0T6D0_PANVG|nr:hypothetical protein PVAP13_4NG142600 [Panicum virgatum]
MSMWQSVCWVWMHAHWLRKSCQDCCRLSSPLPFRTSNGDGVEQAPDLQRRGRGQPSDVVVPLRLAAVLHQCHHLWLPRGCSASPTRHFDGSSHIGILVTELVLGLGNLMALVGIYDLRRRQRVVAGWALECADGQISVLSPGQLLARPSQLLHCLTSRRAPAAGTTALSGLAGFFLFFYSICKGGPSHRPPLQNYF